MTEQKFSKRPLIYDTLTIMRDFQFPCKFRVYDQENKPVCLRNEDAPTNCDVYNCRRRHP